MLKLCAQPVNNRCTKPGKKCVRLSTQCPAYVPSTIATSAQQPTFAHSTRIWHTGFSTAKSVYFTLLFSQLYPFSTAPITTTTK